MRKEKFSYIILVAEIAAIIWLHSVKSPDDKQVTPGNIVNVKSPRATNIPPVNYVQAVHR